MNKKFFFNAFRAGLSLSLIVYILFKLINLENIFLTFKTIDISFLIITLFLQFINLPIRTYRWKLLLLVQNIKVPFIILTSITLVGAFFNNFLPTSMGGDIVRAYEVSKHSNQTVKLVSTVFFQRLAGLIATVFFCFFGILIGIIIGIDLAEIRVIIILLGFFVILSIIFSILIYNIKFLKNIKIIKAILQIDTKNIIKQAYSSVEVYRYHKQESMNILIVSLIAEFIVIIYFYFIALSVNQNINLLYFFIIMPIIAIVEMLPVSINGIGIREGAFLYFFTKIGIPDYIAVSMSLLFYIQKVGVSLIGGMIYAFRNKTDNIKP